MDVDGFLDQIKADPDYAGQIVYVRRIEAREPRYADPARPLSPAVRRMLDARGIERLYAHQVEAIDLARDGRDVVVATGTASGKSLCYLAPLIEHLAADGDARALLTFPTKALSQDQHRAFRAACRAAGLEVPAGVYDGDTPAATRRKLRNGGRVIFTNPDMLHAAIMPQHARWADFLAALRMLVLDEMHVYNGIFGSNMANLLRRFRRVCGHYGSRPQVIGCSATIANPGELARRVTGRDVAVVDDDASPRGRRTYVFWNPPRTRGGNYRSRRSANVEAHDLMAALVRRGCGTITFSKAKMTAEMIHHYVCRKLGDEAPHLVGKVSPYRGGYRPAERREIERRLFDGELLGVSATRALELGIDVGCLDACILVGYPGTLASFFQQSGRAGRRSEDALIVLVGLDTSVNQYVLSHPDYVFGRPVEQAVIDAENPFVATGHLRCAAHELPLGDDETPLFGPYADLVLRILAENRKVVNIDGAWYHAASETPQHEISLRDTADAEVIIQDADTDEVLGSVNQFDAPPILHPEAIYMHRGDTYRVLELDLERNIALVRRENVDYYTDPLGGTDVHHMDHKLRERAFGTGRACWGEVTAYFRTLAYEKVHFYSLDRISLHPVDLPTLALETMAVWLVPPERLMEDVRRRGLDVHSGLRGIGYAMRMMLPLFMTCDTLDFSHSIGSANSEWNAIFVYERYPHGLGFTEKAYELLGSIVPAVLDRVRACECEDGCPCCVGKPLRGYATWHYDRGEASIPSKASALAILDGLLAGGELDTPDERSLTDSDADDELRLETALRRRLERMREPKVFHPIEPNVPLGYPEPEQAETLDDADSGRRNERRSDFHRRLRKRLAKKIDTGELDPHIGRKRPPEGMKLPGSNLPPTHFAGRPQNGPAEETAGDDAPPPAASIRAGDKLAARAKRIRKRTKRNGTEDESPDPPTGRTKDAD